MTFLQEEFYVLNLSTKKKMSKEPRELVLHYFLYFFLIDKNNWSHSCNDKIKVNIFFITATAGKVHLHQKQTTPTILL